MSLRRTLVVALGASALLIGRQAGPASAEVTGVTGSAYGAMVKVGLFGGPPNTVGPAPLAQLPANGGKDEKSLPELIAQFGPATVFGGKYVEPGRNPSGPLKVTTEGKLGRDGSVTSSASIINIGPGPLIADDMSSSCKASEQGLTSSVTITNGIVETKYDIPSQEPIASLNFQIPPNPPPNTSVTGTLDHIGDSYRVVLNEQVIEPGKITVRAAHMYLIGPIAVGDMIVGESVCAVTADQPIPSVPVTTTPATTAAPATTTPPATTAPPATTVTTIDATPATSENDRGPLMFAVVGGAVVILAGGLAAMIRATRGKRAKAPPSG
ncbi:MAG: hypothetical protein ACRD12_24260 [Acidimicrobiales bacterium]